MSIKAGLHTLSKKLIKLINKKGVLRLLFYLGDTIISIQYNFVKNKLIICERLQPKKHEVVITLDSISIY